jgi:cytochrome P450
MTCLLWRALGIVFILGVSALFLPYLYLSAPAESEIRQGHWSKEFYRNYWESKSLIFDHPEPNYQVLLHVAEFWSCVTTIPVAGFLLLWTSIMEDYDVILIGLYIHVLIMYVSAFLSHMTLISPLFSWTVSAVIANSLHAFFWWSCLLGGPLRRYSSILSWVGVIIGISVGVSAIFFIQNLEYFAPIGGFVTLALVQPPFVFLGLCSASYLHFNSPTDPGYDYLFRGGMLLMLAMGISALETFYDPFLLNITVPKSTISTSWTMCFPLLHVIIHILEQVGIYMYGVGVAYAHSKHILKRQNVSIRSDYFIPYVHKGTAPIYTKTKTNHSRWTFDLLDPYPRQCPYAFNQELIHHYPSNLCPVEEEEQCFALWQPSAIRQILKSTSEYSSNPFPDGRLVGLSTTDGRSHDIQRKLISQFFTKGHLENNMAEYRKIANYATFLFVRQGGGDLVGWAYRIAVMSSLCALGIPFNELSRDIQFIDEMAKWSVDLVKLVAPVGGMGPRHYGTTLRQAFTFIWAIIQAIPSTLELIFNIGIVSAWMITRPDLNLFPTRHNSNTPRTGLMHHPDAIRSVPQYANRILHLWIKYGKRSSNQHHLEDTAFSCLYRAKMNGVICESEAIMLIMQCLVSMTTANAIVNAVTDLLVSNDTKPYPLEQLLGNVNLLECYVSESLARSPPLQRLPRRVCGSSGVTVLGQALAPGTHLMLMLGAANQDELTRKSTHYNQTDSSDNPEASSQLPTPSSLTFGLGVHRCLGEELVKVEMKVALVAWLEQVHPYVKSITAGERIHSVDVGNYGYSSFLVSL